jgi:23S rRNA (uracil1939-C5)-methyltransferase
MPPACETSIPSGCEIRCPGCQHRSYTAEKSETLKTQWLAERLGDWLDVIDPMRAVKEERRWNYREKTLVHASWEGSSWKFGMRIALHRDRRGRPEYEVIAIPECPVHSERVRSALKLLAHQLPGSDVLPLVYVSISGALVTLVLKCAERRYPEGLPELCESLTNLEVPLSSTGIKGVFLNFSPSAGHRVFSNRGWVHVWGNETALGPHGLSHGPQSFQQQIADLHDDALEEASDWLAPGSSDFVLDLYSGLGVSVRLWLERGAQTLGVELLGEAVQLSDKDLPGLILRGRVSERIPQIEQKIQAWKEAQHGGLLAFVNPPRTGLESEVVSWLSHVRPRRIAYLSCSAGTLHRDLSQLVNHDGRGYLVKRIIPYDFFPQTQHVETLACLELDSR